MNEWMTKNWTTGELNALVKNLGGEEIARKIQKGEVKVSVEEFLKTLFDKHGRLIPENLKNSVTDEDHDFYLIQPEINYQDILRRVQEFLPDLKFQSLAEFEDKCQAVIEKLNHGPQVENALKRCYLPVPLPHLPQLKNEKQLGQVIEDLLLGVERSYQAEFPSRNFNNHRKGSLAEEVKLVKGSRHESVIAKLSSGPQSGILLPNPLQGFSINAYREIIAKLPDYFSLAGLEHILAMIAYPKTLARDYNTPGIDLAAFSWQSALSLCFKANGGWLNFALKADLGNADSHYSGGLCCLG